MGVGWGGGGSREVERGLGRGVEQTARSSVALLGEELIGYPHLDVVCLAGEHEQGLVLCLPSEAGNCPVVCTAVRIAAQVRVRVPRDAQPRLEGCVGLNVRDDR